MDFFSQKTYDARNLLDVYVVSAIIAVALTRTFLYLTGYPQLGGDGLHIAHVLWGGLLMMVGTLLLLLSQNPNRRLAAIISGAGFGLFIDEVGKFITSDVNYFYKPAAVIVYLSFVIIWLIGRAIITRSLKEPLLPAVAWPENKWLGRAMRVFLVILAMGVVVDVIALLFDAFQEPHFNQYGNGLLAFLLYGVNVVYIALLILAFVRYRQGRKQQALTIVREALVLSLVTLMPVNFYRDQFSAIASLLYYLTFIGIISRPHKWQKLKQLAKKRIAGAASKH